MLIEGNPWGNEWLWTVKEFLLSPDCLLHLESASIHHGRNETWKDDDFSNSSFLNCWSCCCCCNMVCQFGSIRIFFYSTLLFCYACCCFCCCCWWWHSISTEDKRTISPDCRAVPPDTGAGRRQILRHHLRTVRLSQFKVGYVLLLQFLSIYFWMALSRGSFLKSWICLVLY